MDIIFKGWSKDYETLPYFGVGDYAAIDGGIRVEEDFPNAQEIADRFHPDIRAWVDAKNREADKAARQKAVDGIIVTTLTGKTFDGDEDSQRRMLTAIQVAEITGQTSTVWRLADNTDQTVTLDELREALALAAQEMSALWFA